MGLFANMLGSGESIFKNEDALEAEFIPKLMPYRNLQQHYLASCIKPLLAERNGRNVFVFGAPGIGKTAAVRWVLRDLNDNSDDVRTLYVNCWQKNTTFQIYVDICHQLEYMFTQNKRAEELLNIIKNICNKKGVVFVFDEIDKAEDYEFLYSLLTDIYRRSIILITNYKEWLTDMEQRLQSRLVPEVLEFKEYTCEETEGILKQRIECAFVSDVWSPEGFSLVAKTSFELKDIRMGIHLLREAGLAAEEKASKKILLEHSKTAVQKIQEISLRKSSDLEEDSQLALAVCKEQSGGKIGDLFKTYKERGGQGTYKTFQRKIAKLEQSNFIIATKVTGKDGNTTLIRANEKKLTDY